MSPRRVAGSPHGRCAMKPRNVGDFYDMRHEILGCIRYAVGVFSQAKAGLSFFAISACACR